MHSFQVPFSCGCLHTWPVFTDLRIQFQVTPQAAHLQWVQFEKATMSLDWTLLCGKFLIAVAQGIILHLVIMTFTSFWPSVRKGEHRHYNNDEGQVGQWWTPKTLAGFFHHGSCSTGCACDSILKIKQWLWSLLGGHRFRKINCS